MRARGTLGALLAACALALLAATPAPPRVVSLNPSLTQILLALDAEAALVGVDESSARLEPRVRGLPRVGGLFNPSLEAIVALSPDFVALVPSAQQRGLALRLAALGIEALPLNNHGFDELLDSIERLGDRVGRGDAARVRAAEIRAAFRAAETRTRTGAPPRTVLVLQRDPLFVVGGGSYLDVMLRAAGAENAAAGFDEAYPQVSVEWLIAAAPELILDVADPVGEALAHWQRWPSLPAVAAGRVLALDDSGLTMPGPYLDRALERLIERVDDAPGLSSERVDGIARERSSERVDGIARERSSERVDGIARERSSERVDGGAR